MTKFEKMANTLYANCLYMGCGFRHEGDKVIVLVPSKYDRKGREHPVLQAELDKCQPSLIKLVPRHGVMPDPWRPPTTESIVPYVKEEKLNLIGNGIEGAERQVKRKAAILANRKKQWAKK